MKVKFYFKFSSLLTQKILIFFFLLLSEVKESSKNTDQVETQNSTVTEETNQDQVTTETETVQQQQQEMGQEDQSITEGEHHPTNDEIEEYEEAQRKFKELWEAKREKVSVNLFYNSKISLRKHEILSSQKF